jgi:anti-anti-sigma factor
MAFQTRTHVDGDVASIKLVGELDSRAAHRFNGVIAELTAQPLSRLVLLMEELSYMSSAGLRCLVFAHQKLGRGVEIVLVGTQQAVAETISLTGFDRSIVMQDPLGT